jgi:putative membrane protein
MKSLFYIMMIALVFIGCGPGNRKNGAFDTNPAENSEGDIERKNSETNEEYEMRVAQTNHTNPEDKIHPGLTELSAEKTEVKQTFATKAADAGLAEVHLAEMALKKTKNQKIKAFAEMMLKDHSAANEELKGIVSNKGIKLPTECLTCDAAYKELHDMGEVEFNDRYAEMMVSDHEHAVKLFSQEAKSGDDPDLKNWAQKKLPALQHHLAMAKDLKPTTNISADRSEEKVARPDAVKEKSGDDATNKDKKATRKEKRKAKKQQRASKG